MIQNALDIIKDASVLAAKDFSSLVALQDELKQTWETVQVFRTRTEMEVSVLQDIKHPTPDSKYWQAIREQNVMFTELVGLSYEYRKKSVELRKLQRDLKNLTEPWNGEGSDWVAQDDLEIELKQIEIEQTEWTMLQMERVAQDRIREILEWSDIKKKLLPDMEYGVDNVDRHQMESFYKRFNAEANNITPHTPPADAINLAGKAVTVNRIKKSKEIEMKSQIKAVR